MELEGQKWKKARLERGGKAVHRVVFEVWSPDQQHQHHSKTFSKHGLSGPIQDLLNQKVQGLGPTICVLTSPLGNFDTHSHLRTTVLHSVTQRKSVDYGHLGASLKWETQAPCSRGFDCLGQRGPLLLQAECLCPAPQFIYQSPDPQCNGIWRTSLWEIIKVILGHESRVLMVGFLPLQKEEEAGDLSLSPTPISLSPHIKKGLYEDIIRKRVLTKNLTMLAPWSSNHQNCEA